MKTLIFTILSVYLILPFHCRLIPKSSERTTALKPADDPPSRVTRAIFDDTANVFSKEEEGAVGLSGETLFDNKKASSHLKTTRQALKMSRIERDSTESNDENITKSTTTKKIPKDKKKKLVKKPIPKFHDMDYYDDGFQANVIKSKSPIESGEHEDEDFNLDDYEFDVNHDEFSARGKPLIPRNKNKQSGRSNADESETVLTTSESYTNTDKPHRNTGSSASSSGSKMINKRNNQGNKKHKEDYYDDYSSTTKSSEAKSKARDSDDASDEADETKELDHKSPRVIRSLWKPNKYINHQGRKAALVSKVRDYLSFFF
ncbi:uncharacterized protein LOC126380365 [Pectinophora gossypiella]|uniref:uncharacterized protein LOC126380365 n=1 Tax=Pectinophora gossypiella TaxID=13191 RepID=UPI00214E55C5|nr:uncharacterized protein LOC126380365 [Pectinophora gossypiella]